MAGLLRHPFRIIGRLFWVGGVILVAILDFLFHCTGGNKAARAQWLHRNSRRMLRVFRYKSNVTGSIPPAGLLVSNHLSYLDVLVIGSLTPAVFVSKSEVRDWPLFGWLASLAGTLFVDRQRRTQVGIVNQQIQSVLNENVFVVLFPEGTSSNGLGVLPFKTSLLEPIAGGSHPVSVCWLHYAIDDGDPGQEVCYWGDHVFVPHLLNMLGKRQIRATVRFAPFQKNSTDRKELAVQLREEVLKLKGK